MKSKKSGRRRHLPGAGRETRIPFFLIGKHLRHCNKWTLALIIFLLSAAFINLIFINSLFNGVVENNTNQFIHTYTGNITLTPADDGKMFEDASPVLREVEKNPEVTAAAAELVIPATLQYGEQKGDWKVTAIDPEREKNATTISRKMVEGAYLEPGDADGMIIGSEVAGLDSQDGDDRGLRGIRVGDTVTATVDELPARDLTIRGIFRTRFNRTDDRAFVTTAAVDLFPQMKGKATQIIVRTRKNGGEDAVVAELKAAGVPATFLTWEQAAKGMQSITDSFVTINALLTSVGFIIAAVTIFIIIYVDISNRRQEIGILRAVGVKGYLITWTYVLQAAVYSFCGVVLGTALFFGVIVPYFRIHPFRLPIGDVNLAVVPVDYVWRSLSVVFVGMLSGLIPALIITREKILDAILGR
ncbi:MAG: hypothetical protein KKF41_14030 [Actinobacteria bacterium]|nr:hypothetical protein [Actinomycetota bacterium]MBU1942632.1 hypothetical protein [Actinomycetota bacterium]MBU2688692.1 hypothetical protein [Actinomycetota bacterium]